MEKLFTEAEGVLLEVVFGGLVGLGEDEAEGDTVLAKKVGKLYIFLLRRYVAVDKQEDVDEVLTLEQVVIYHLLPLVALLHRGFGKAVAREVDQVPLAVNEVVIDGYGLAGLSGGTCEVVLFDQ